MFGLDIRSCENTMLHSGTAGRESAQRENTAVSGSRLFGGGGGCWNLNVAYFFSSPHWDVHGGKRHPPWGLGFGCEAKYKLKNLKNKVNKFLPLSGPSRAIEQYSWRRETSHQIYWVTNKKSRINRMRVKCDPLHNLIERTPSKTGKQKPHNNCTTKIWMMFYFFSVYKLY